MTLFVDADFAGQCPGKASAYHPASSFGMIFTMRAGNVGVAGLYGPVRRVISQFRRRPAVSQAERVGFRIVVVSKVGMQPYAACRYDFRCPLVHGGRIGYPVRRHISRCVDCH